MTKVGRQKRRMGTSGEERPVAAVERALSVLASFSEHEPVLSLGAIADHTGLYKSTILRLLGTLEGFGYVVKAPDGNYRIGPTPFRLGRAFQLGIQPAEIIMPPLKLLMQKTGESASFSIRQHDMHVVLYRVSSTNPVRSELSPGEMFPLSRGSAGALFLAFAKPYDPAYAQVRRKLFAVSVRQVKQESTGVSCPIFDSDGEITGALSLVGPASRLNRDALREAKELLLTAAPKLTDDLGGDTTFYTRKPGASHGKFERHAVAHQRSVDPIGSL